LAIVYRFIPPLRFAMNLRSALKFRAYQKGGNGTCVNLRNVLVLLSCPHGDVFFGVKRFVNRNHNIGKICCSDASEMVFSVRFLGPPDETSSAILGFAFGWRWSGWLSAGRQIFLPTALYGGAYADDRESILRPAVHLLCLRNAKSWTTLRSGALVGEDGN
jgi:hypothetical protein